MAVTKEQKANRLKEFTGGNTNTGDTGYQIAVLTDEINNLTEHLKEHKQSINCLLEIFIQKLFKNLIFK